MILVFVRTNIDTVVTTLVRTLLVVYMMIVDTVKYMDLNIVYP